MSIAARLQSVQNAIAEAARSQGRDPQTVKLVAVSKLNPVGAVEEAAAAGQMDFGENHVQELVGKQALLPHLRWHMIGTLQRNKVKYIAPFIHLIHSVDSERLLAEINLQGGKCNRTIPCLLQINISDETQKGGFQEAEAATLLAGIAQYPHVSIHGLMGMAAFTDDVELVRSQFQRLRRAAEAFKVHENGQVKMEELSMGMSGDYPIAIAEGATLVRVGSSIFGERNYH